MRSHFVRYSNINQILCIRLVEILYVTDNQKQTERDCERGVENVSNFAFSWSCLSIFDTYLLYDLESGDVQTRFRNNPLFLQAYRYRYDVDLHSLSVTY